MFTVYTLIDPRDDAVRYVGVTDDVYKRFSQHVQCGGNNIDKNEWIQELKDENLMLIMRTLEQVETVEVAREREDYWIHHYLSHGSARLLNIQISRSFTFEAFQSFFGKGKFAQPAEAETETEDEDILVESPSVRRKGAYAITKEAASKYLRCPLSEIERGISEGIIKPFAKDPDKVLRSTLEGFVPRKRSRKAAKIAVK